MRTPEATTPEVLAHAWCSVSIVVVIVVVATAIIPMMSVMTVSMVRVATIITLIVDIRAAARRVVSRSSVAVLVSIYDVDSVPMMLGLLLLC